MSKPASISMGSLLALARSGARAANAGALVRNLVASGHRRRGPWLRVRQTPDDDGDGHSLFVLGLAEIGSVKRNGLAGVPRHRDANEVPAAHNAVGRIEFDPAGARQEDLAPRMGRAAAAMTLLRVAARHIEIARDEPGGEAEGSRPLHHQRREIAAGAAPRR